MSEAVVKEQPEEKCKAKQVSPDVHLSHHDYCQYHHFYHSCPLWSTNSGSICSPASLWLFSILSFYHYCPSWSTHSFIVYLENTSQTGRVALWSFSILSLLSPSMSIVMIIIIINSQFHCVFGRHFADRLYSQGVVGSRWWFQPENRILYSLTQWGFNKWERDQRWLYWSYHTFHDMTMCCLTFQTNWCTRWLPLRPPIDQANAMTLFLLLHFSILYPNYKMMTIFMNMVWFIKRTSRLYAGASWAVTRSLSKCFWFSLDSSFIFFSLVLTSVSLIPSVESFIAMNFSPSFVLPSDGVILGPLLLFPPHLVMKVVTIMMSERLYNFKL